MFLQREGLLNKNFIMAAPADVPVQTKQQPTCQGAWNTISWHANAHGESHSVPPLDEELKAIKCCWKGTVFSMDKPFKKHIQITDNKGTHVHTHIHICRYRYEPIITKENIMNLRGSWGIWEELEEEERNMELMWIQYLCSNLSEEN